MSPVPHELIHEVRICTRAAAGLPEYDPSDPSLPSLPPLSAAIAASDSSAPNLRCKNCKGMLLRGTESIICLYCGLGPHYDAVPGDICFTSSIGYQWLLRSLRLDGSEMVDLSEKSEQNVSQNSPKSLTRLSEFLNFKISWPAETEKQETSSDKHSEDSKRSLSLTGVAPDAFFLNSNRNPISDIPIEQPSDRQTEAAARKDVAALENQDLFRNVQSSEPAFSSSEHKTGEALSGWEADFQSADSETEHSCYRSSEHVAGASADSGIKFPDPESFQTSSADSGMKFQDPESFQSSSADSGIKFQDPEPFHSSSGPEVDLSIHFDSMFGPVANLKDEKPKESQAVSPAFDDCNSDDTWNNLSSSEPNFSGGFDANFSTSNEPQNDRTLGRTMDNSTTDDLFPDFQFQTNFTDMTKNESTNEDHRTMDEDLFEDWDDFIGSTSLQVPSKNDQDFSYDEKSSERDLFSFNNKFEGDFGGFSQANLFSTSTSTSNAPTEVNAILSENPAAMLTDTSSPSLGSAGGANDEDAFGRSTEDDVKMLISQMHDLSFMLETDLSIPSGSDSVNSSRKD
ncbi:hypothetical protein ACS0TY_001403 [Phlomoides rotata]